MRRSRKVWLSAGALALAAGAWLIGRPYVHSASMIVQVIGESGRARAVADLINAQRFTEQDLAVPTRYGPVRARFYRPETVAGRTILATPGVNPAGIDEPRLVAFARALARAGRPAMTIELPDLTHYRISTRDIDRLEDAARWLSGRSDLTGGQRIGVAGVSFAAGLMLAAAGRPSLQHTLALVVSVGGYGDLGRVVRFLCLGTLPDGTQARPHDYGLAVVLLNVLDRLVPAEQVEPLRRAVLTFMDASWLDLTDAAAAQRTFALARTLQDALPEPSATVMRWVNDRDVETAGPKLLPYALAIAEDPALSPERSSPPDAPVYLLHGVGDTVIPTQESERLAAWLAPRTRVRLLVTPLLLHVETGSQWQGRDAWALLRFWSAALEE